jgi:hypothetical protein
LGKGKGPIRCGHLPRPLRLTPPQRHSSPPPGSVQARPSSTPPGSPTFRPRTLQGTLEREAIITWQVTDNPWSLGPGNRRRCSSGIFLKAPEPLVLVAHSKEEGESSPGWCPFLLRHLHHSPLLRFGSFMRTPLAQTCFLSASSLTHLALAHGVFSSP